MEILNKNAAFLSNSEVYALLKQIKQDQAQKLIKKKNLKNQVDAQQLDINIDKHLPTIVYESLRYLEKTPCIHQTSTVVNEFLIKCEERKNEFKLTKIEKLQILNLRPSSAVELQYIIEDSEERFTIEQMDELLEFIQSNLPNESYNISEENTSNKNLESKNN
jgi:hypothetical protein